MPGEAQPEPNALAELIRPVWSEPKTCEALAVTGEALAAMSAEGGVLRLVTADGDPVFPVWQFYRDGEQVVVKPGLVPVFRTLRDFDPWAVVVLLHTPAPELDGLTPLDWLQQGSEPEVVARLAAAVAREWGAGAA